MNRSFKYGDGFFETIRVEKGQPTLWPFHADRILLSFDVMGMTLPGTGDLDRILENLLSECKDMDIARARITFYRSGGGGYRPDSNDFEYEIEVNPIEHFPGSLFPTHTGNYNDMIREIGELPTQKVGLYPDAGKLFTPFSFLKSTSSVLYVQAALYAGQMGWDDAFVCNEKGYVIETTDSNLFAVFNNKVYTPPLQSGCVAGVCRAYLLDRYEILEASFSWEDLNSADMIFRSNALHGVRRIEIA